MPKPNRNQSRSLREFRIKTKRKLYQMKFKLSMYTHTRKHIINYSQMLIPFYKDTYAYVCMCTFFSFLKAKTLFNSYFSKSTNLKHSLINYAVIHRKLMFVLRMASVRNMSRRKNTFVILKLPFIKKYILIFNIKKQKSGGRFRIFRFLCILKGIGWSLKQKLSTRCRCLLGPDHTF